MGGIRCSNCGFTPSITERTAAELRLRASMAQVATQPVATQPVAPQRVAKQPIAKRPIAKQPVAKRPVATQYAAVPMAIESEPVVRQASAMQTWMRDVAQSGLARWRGWFEELGPPSVRTWITAAAAGLAVAFAIAVVVTIG